MPGETGATVVTTLVWFLFFPREAAGAMGTRHSPRPLWGEGYMDNSGLTRRGDADVCPGLSSRRAVPHPRCHHPPTGPALGRPDDRLRRVIQYSRDAGDRTEGPRRTGYP